MGRAIRSGHQNAMKDMAGIVFGRLTVIGEAGRSRSRKAMWLCRCECGTEKRISGCDLRRGSALSCGCLRREKGRINVTHGAADSPEYETWCHMKRRCHNINDPSYHRYGGRGIVVCDRWRDSFSDFLADMGPRTTPTHTIERIDNDGPYSPDNCRWATRLEQAANTRKIHHLTLRGETMNLHEWARRTGINVKTITSRIRYGWPTDKILTTPPRNRGR